MKYIHINNPKYKNVGLYGFAPWPDEATTLPPTNPQNDTMANICIITIYRMLWL